MAGFYLKSFQAYFFQEFTSIFTGKQVVATTLKMEWRKVETYLCRNNQNEHPNNTRIL
jgi:hypothetical protein